MTLLVLTLLTTPVLADVVGPEPENCPDGSDPWSSHAGNWCEASYCADDVSVARYVRCSNTA